MSLPNRQDLVAQTVNNFITLYFHEHRKEPRLKLGLTALVDRCVDENPEYGFRKAALLVREYDFENGELVHYPPEGNVVQPIMIPASNEPTFTKAVNNFVEPARIPLKGYVDIDEVRKLFPQGDAGQNAFDKAFRGCTMLVNADKVMLPVEDLHDYMMRRNFRD